MADGSWPHSTDADPAVLTSHLTAEDLACACYLAPRAYRHRDRVLRGRRRTPLRTGAIPLLATLAATQALIRLGMLPTPGQLLGILPPLLIALGSTVSVRLLLALRRHGHIRRGLVPLYAGRAGFPATLTASVGHDGITVWMGDSTLRWGAGIPACAAETPDLLVVFLQSVMVPLRKADAGAETLRHLRHALAALGIPVAPARDATPPLRTMALAGLTSLALAASLRPILTPRPSEAASPAHTLVDLRSLRLPDRSVSVAGERIDLAWLWDCEGLFDGTSRRQLSGEFRSAAVAGSFAVDDRVAGAAIPGPEDEFRGPDRTGLAYGKVPSDAVIGRLGPRSVAAAWIVARRDEVAQRCVAIHRFYDPQGPRAALRFARSVFVKACSASLQFQELLDWSREASPRLRAAIEAAPPAPYTDVSADGPAPDL